MTRKTKNTTVLARVNFPLYSVQLLTCRHILVAGGGGSSKTGVSNGFECYELSYNDGLVNAKEILRHETGSNVVMNCAVLSKDKHSYIIAGQESHCQLYKVKCCICLEDGDIIPNHNENNRNPNGTLRNRKSNPNHSSNGIVYNKSMTFQILPENSVQTDFHVEEPVQRVVRANPNENLIVTGGTDGHIRLWEFPSLKLKLDINAHEKEIDDLDFDPTSTQVVSVSKDGTAVIWDISTGNKLHDLKWTPPNGTKYLYKRCRFTVTESDPNISCLFMITNPIGSKIGKKSAQIQLWNSRRGILVKQTEFNESLSALAVRNDGKFIAVGTMFTGTVLILTSFSLQVVLKIPNAHSMFVTGLEFVPVPIADDDSFTTISEASVISISVDNKICIHNLPYRDSIPTWIFLLFVFFIVIVTLTICAVIGL